MKHHLLALAAVLLSMAASAANSTKTYTVAVVYDGTKATVTIPNELSGYVSCPSGESSHVKLIQAETVSDKTTGEIIVKVVNTSKQTQPVTLNLQGIKGSRTAETLTLSWSGSMDDENTLDQPEKITPKTGSIGCTADKKQTVLNDELPAMSFRIYKIKK